MLEGVNCNFMGIGFLIVIFVVLKIFFFMIFKVLGFFLVKNIGGKKLFKFFLYNNFGSL